MLCYSAESIQSGPLLRIVVAEAGTSQLINAKEKISMQAKVCHLYWVFKQRLAEDQLTTQ